MFRIYKITFFTVLISVICMISFNVLLLKDHDKDNTLKIGFVYVGDASNIYSTNFIKVQNKIDSMYGDKVVVSAKYNVAEGTERKYISELIDEGCEMIFSTSYGYQDVTKELAQKYPDIQFIMATGANSQKKPILKNYHTFMGAIYQGRYISGVIAGMKLFELLQSHKITKEQAKIGYVAAFPYAEVVSGYTAFLMGIHSIVPGVKMHVRYTHSWDSFYLDKMAAEELIKEGCVMISQHSDTSGAAVACEKTSAKTPIYLVSYNKSMSDIAPTTYITGSKINWEPYMLQAVEAVLKGKQIESYVKGTVNGRDICGGFKEDWIRMLDLNELTAPQGAQSQIDSLISRFKNGTVEVFKGNYQGVNPFDANDTIDLNKGYVENKYRSAPSFNYILKDYVIIDNK